MENLEPETKILKTESETAAQVRKAECQDPKFHLAVKRHWFSQKSSLSFLKFKFALLAFCGNQVCVSENSRLHEKNHARLCFWEFKISLKEPSLRCWEFKLSSKESCFFFQNNQVFVSKGSSCCKSLWAPSYATSQFRLAVCHTLKLPDTIFYVFSLIYNISLNILQLLLSLWILQFCLCSATVRLCYHVCGRLPTWTAICTSERHRGNSRRCHQFSVSISTGWRCPCGGYWCLVRSVGDHNQNLCPRQRFYSCIYLWVHS